MGSGLLLVLVAAVVPLFAIPASAAETRPEASSFNGSDSDAGAFESLGRVVVHQASGTVYAIDNRGSGGVVDKFDSAGAATDFSALSSSSLDGSAVSAPDGPVAFDLGSDSDLAVDNSGTASDGRVYVLQEYGANPHTVFAFDAAGNYLHKIDVAGADTCGIAVDSTGNVWIADYNNFSVIEYTAGGAATGSSIDTSGQGNPCHVAFDSDDNLYVALYGGALQKYDAAGVFQGQIDAATTSAVAVDPATDHAFAVHFDGVSEYDDTGASVIDFARLLSSPIGAAVRGSSDTAYVSDSSDGEVHVFGPVAVLPDVTTGAASDIAKTTATVSGAVNPDSVAVTDCHFEYTDETDFQANGFANATDVACVPAGADIGGGGDAVAVSAQLSGLVPLTSYHFRLVAANVDGAAQGTGESFQTALPDLPIATTDGTSAGVSTALRTLEGRANPNGSALTACRFEYGTTTDYGRSSSCDQSPASLGSGSTDQPVTATTAPLEPNTTYHYRLRLSNVAGDSTGEDRSVTTGDAPSDACPNAGVRAEQGINALLLPDCMALEQVSPSAKHNQFARDGVISRDGSRVLFGSISAIGETPYVDSAFGDRYVASRGASGWTSAPTTPALPYRGIARGFSADFSSWFEFASTSEQAPDEEPVISRVFRGGLSREFSPMSPLLVPLSGLRGRIASPVLIDASVDRSRVYFQPYEGDGAPLDRTTTFLPGDPQPAPPDLSDNNTYVAGLDSDGDRTLALLARDRDGKEWGGNCGTRLGGFKPFIGSELILPNGERTQGAVSPEGARVYFMTRPGQPATGGCDTSNKMRILERVETSTGPNISELFSSECDREPPNPPCSSTDGDDVFQGASIDQTKVYFTTNRQLADSDLDSSAASCDNATAVVGCDLYLYDSTRPLGERLTQVSAGDETAATPGSGANVRNGIAAISADGSHAYFSARSVLTTNPNPAGAVAQDGENNFYAYSHTDGALAFVGTLSTADTASGRGLFGAGPTWQGDAYPVPVGDGDDELGGDGHVLLFSSRAALTPDDADSSADIYRYDADAQTLDHISKAAPGGGDDGPFDVDISGARTDYFTGWASEDGQTAVFTSGEALVPGDVNGVEDGYMWRDGELFRLPGSDRKPGSPGSAPTVSGDGKTVAYASNDSLVVSDGDSVQDMYVAYVGGGFALSSAPKPCDPLADACQGSGAAPGSPLNQTVEGGTGNTPMSARATVVVSALGRAQRVALAQGRKVALRVRVNKAGRVRVRGSARIGGRARRVLGATRKASKAGAFVVSLRLSRAALSRLASGRRLSVRLAVTFSGARRSTSTLKLASTRMTASRKGGRS